MRPRLSDLPATYQDLFLAGRFPEGGTLFPAAISPVADTAFALMVGVPSVALGTGSLVVASGRAEAVLAAAGHMFGGAAPAAAPLATLAILVPVLLAFAAAGLLTVARAAATWREAAARRRGRCHYGLWLDAEAMVLRLPGLLGRGTVALLPRTAVRDARFEKVRTRDSVLAEPQLLYQSPAGLEVLPLPSAAFAPRPTAEVLATVRSWSSPSHRFIHDNHGVTTVRRPLPQVPLRGADLPGRRWSGNS